MKFSELFSRWSFKALGRAVGLDIQMVEGHRVCTPLDPGDPRYSMDFVMPSMKMVSACRADDFDFFQPFIAAGKLTVEQRHHAAQRYHLGKTKSGQPIYWMIDDMLQPLDAHIGQDLWISQLLKKREPLLDSWQVHHCLFGLHLLHTDSTDNTDSSLSPAEMKEIKEISPSEIATRSQISAISAISSTKDRSVALQSAGQEKPICIVESESSAVVLSELFPDSIWMAYCTVPHLDILLFEPLQGRTVTIYPCTDPYMSNLLFFEELCESVCKQYDITLSVDCTLEDHATEDQKSRCIDLLDFLLESLTHTDLTDSTDS